MGKGAFINIDNRCTFELMVDYKDVDDVDLADFEKVAGTVAGGTSLPGPQTYQYIEATGTDAAFDMVFYSTIHIEVARISFKMEDSVWYAEDPYRRQAEGTWEVQAVVIPGDVRIEPVSVPSGEPTPGEDQYLIKVTVQPSTDLLDRWMGTIRSSIENTPLCELPIPGCHDAISYKMRSPHAASQTQSRTVLQQLEAGYRYFDFRVAQLNDVFYGVHGGATTDIDYVTWGGAKGNEPYVFDDIVEFLDDPNHHDEMVILCFSHFANFDPSDAVHFWECITYVFADRLIPSTNLAPTSTFGDLQGSGTRPRQVIALINDTGTDQPLRRAWPTDDALWRTSGNWRDRYSDIGYSGGDDLDKYVIETLQDQEAHLDPSPGNRNLSRFWVTQPILNCDAAMWFGHDLSWWAANDASPLATFVYEHHWWNGNSVEWRNGTSIGPVSKPNIMIVDFAGDFDGFPAACVRMVT